MFKASASTSIRIVKDSCLSSSVCCVRFLVFINILQYMFVSTKVVLRIYFKASKSLVETYR
jgi:hypothetical protein